MVCQTGIFGFVVLLTGVDYQDDPLPCPYYPGRE